MHARPAAPIAVTAAFVALLVTALAPATRAQQAPGEGALPEFTVGVYKLEAGMVVEATDHLERAWRYSRHAPEVGLKLGEAYYLLKNFSRCELVIDDVLASSPHNRDGLLLKAKVRYIRRDAEGAVQYLEQVREHHSASFEVERLLGNVYFEMGRVPDAIAAYGRCLAIDWTYPYIQYRYGRLLVVEGREEEAEAAFRRAMDLDPGFVEPGLALADILLDGGRSDEAIAVLSDVVENDPRNERAVTVLAELFLDARRYDEGVVLLERWKEHSPLSRETQIMLGRLYFEQGDMEAALGVFEAMFRDQPDSAELARIMGELHLKIGDEVAARDFMERAIDIDPSDYRNYLAVYFASSERFTGGHHLTVADDDMDRFLAGASEAVEGADFEGNYLVGVALLGNDKLDLAERHLKRANELRDGDFDTLMNLATVYERRRDWESAMPYLDRLLEMRPDDPTVLNFYGYCLAERGVRLDEALEMVRRALAKDPDNGYFLDSLGWIYYQMGDYGRAVTEIEKASERVGDDPVILEHLGDAYAAIQRFNDARAAYVRSRELQDSDSISEKIQATSRDR